MRRKGFDAIVLFGHAEGGPVTLVVPVEGTTDNFLISIGRKLAVVVWDGKSSTPTKVC